MTTKQALKKSRSHWKRMIDYVIKYNGTNRLTEFPIRNLLSVFIGETWLREYCALCELNYYICSKCSLNKIGECCNPRINPDSIWQNVNDAQTWNEWLEYAWEMYIVLDILYRKEA